MPYNLSFFRIVVRIRECTSIVPENIGATLVITLLIHGDKAHTFTHTHTCMRACMHMCTHAHTPWQLDQLGV
jgi:hypothetical protein